MPGARMRTIVGARPSLCAGASPLGRRTLARRRKLCRLKGRRFAARLGHNRLVRLAERVGAERDLGELLGITVRCGLPRYMDKACPYEDRCGAWFRVPVGGLLPDGMPAHEIAASDLRLSVWLVASHILAPLRSGIIGAPGHRARAPSAAPAGAASRRAAHGAGLTPGSLSNRGRRLPKQQFALDVPRPNQQDCIARPVDSEDGRSTERLLQSIRYITCKVLVGSKVGIRH